MISVPPLHTNFWIRLLTLAILEHWEAKGAHKKISPDIVAKLESNLAKKLNDLPFLPAFVVRILSIITRTYCIFRFRSINFKSEQKKKCISNWLMYSTNPITINYRLFIEKFTILYLMDEFEKIEFQENTK